MEPHRIPHRDAPRIQDLATGSHSSESPEPSVAHSVCAGGNDPHREQLQIFICHDGYLAPASWFHAYQRMVGRRTFVRPHISCGRLDDRLGLAWLYRTLAKALCNTHQCLWIIALGALGSWTSNKVCAKRNLAFQKADRAFIKVPESPEILQKHIAADPIGIAGFQ